MRSKADIIRVGDIAELTFARFDQYELRFGSRCRCGRDYDRTHDLLDGGGGRGRRCAAGRNYEADDRRRDQERF